MPGTIGSSEEKRISEAQSKGWTLISKVSTHYFRYRHDACGHEQDMTPGNVRTGNPVCRGCSGTATKWAAEAWKGWTFLRQEDRARGVYRHACGHEQVVQASAMRKGSVRCRGCDNPVDDWKAEVREGWTFLRQLNGDKALYCHSCGAEKEARPSHMREGRVRCNACDTTLHRWTREAKDKGWTLVEQTADKIALYRHDACGAEREARADAIRRNSVACTLCGGKDGRKARGRLKRTEKVVAAGQRRSTQAVARYTEQAGLAGWIFIEKLETQHALCRHVACGHEQRVSTAAIRKHRIECDICDDPEPRWRVEAEDQGWVYFRRDGDLARYRHIECGHEQSLDRGAMRNGRIRCGGCQNSLDRWIREARERKWDLVAKIDANRGRYRHVCGHEQSVIASQMREGYVRCGGCQNSLDRWIREALKQGWSYLEKERDGTALYRHACGHEQNVGIRDMRRGWVRCGGCENVRELWASEARQRGWTLLEQIGNSYGMYRHDACGNIQKAASGNMRSHDILCLVCDDPEPRWKAEAEDQGWFFLEKHPQYTASYRHECGHEQICHIGAMKLGTVRCGGCEPALVSALHIHTRRILTELGLDFTAEQHFKAPPDLAQRFGVHWMRADFVVRAGDMPVLLEIDGHQHFRQQMNFTKTRAAEQFAYQVRRDVLIEHLARNRGMRILRIGSWEGRGTLQALLERVATNRLDRDRLVDDMSFPARGPSETFWTLRAQALAASPPEGEKAVGVPKPRRVKAGTGQYILPF